MLCNNASVTVFAFHILLVHFQALHDLYARQYIMVKGCGAPLQGADQVEYTKPRVQQAVPPVTER